MKVLLDSSQIKEILNQMAEAIVNNTPAGADIAVIGIRSRGEILAKRLSETLSDKLKTPIPFGALDITLYRDDFNSPPRSQPQVKTTEISFDIDDLLIILVDDVLQTGRSARAALDALIDIGRPTAIRLAVLIDRQGREFPIQADYAGYKADNDTDNENKIIVQLTESDNVEQVIME